MATKQRRAKYKLMINEYKDRPCAICNNKYANPAMDLHHIDPATKDYEISGMFRSLGYDKIKLELEKCAVLCAVCHRLLHAGVVEYPMSDSN